MNRKAQTNQIWIIIILFIVAIVLLGAFWMYATAAPILVGQTQSLTSIFRTSLTATGGPGSALSNATNIAADVSDSIVGSAQIVSYFLFAGLFMGFLVVCYYVRTYKWLAVAWIGLMAFLVFISMIMSNAYQEAYTTSSDLQAFYNTWGTSNFIMQYLPYITLVLGMLSGIVLFVLISTDSEEETRQIL